jgi:hypothetical protein
VNLDDPEVVREQYATEEGLEERRSIYQGVEGEDAKEVTVRAIAACRPRRVLDVGSGPGELSARMTAELGDQGHRLRGAAGVSSPAPRGCSVALLETRPMVGRDR